MPFSYINEVDGHSVLSPGMNFFTVGTMRDAEKWPARDRRKGARKLDRLIFDVLSPFTIQKMLRGMRALDELYQTADREQEYVAYNGIKIKRLILRNCKKYYQVAVDKYFGDTILKRLKKTGAAKIQDLLKTAKNGAVGEAEWIDVCGLLCAQPRLDTLLAEVVTGKIDTFEKLHAALTSVFNAYEDDEWNWLLITYKKINGRELCVEPAAALAQLIDRWKDASLKLVDMVLNDAEKEFTATARIGFGIDGPKDADFEAVRGTYEGNKFVKKLKESKAQVAQEAERLKTMI
jgi:hypothetical protein